MSGSERRPARLQHRFWMLVRTRGDGPFSGVSPGSSAPPSPSAVKRPRSGLDLLCTEGVPWAEAWFEVVNVGRVGSRRCQGISHSLLECEIIIKKSVLTAKSERKGVVLMGKSTFCGYPLFSGYSGEDGQQGMGPHLLV